MDLGAIFSGGSFFLNVWEKIIKPASSNPPTISFNFVRLFGLHGISRIWLRHQEDQGREIGEFLRSWEYANAGVISSEPLDWLSKVSVTKIILDTHPRADILAKFGEGSSAQWTSRQGGGFLISSPRKMTDADLAHFHDPDCWRFDECACFACCPTLQSVVMDQDSNLGALAVIIENRSETEISKLRLNYVFVSDDSPGEAIERSKSIPSLARGKAVIWPLRVYLGDSRGFEARILSPNVIPQSISYEIGGKSSSIHVRPPLREKAAKVKVPGGWYHQ